MRGARGFADRTPRRCERIVRRDHLSEQRENDEERDHRETQCGGGPAQQTSPGVCARRRGGGDGRQGVDDRGHQWNRIRGFTSTYAMSASRFSTMYAVAVNKTTPWTTA